MATGDSASTDDPVTQLRTQGIVLLRDVFPKKSLSRLREAAERCFQAIESEAPIPDRYGFSRSSHSVHLTALMDFGCRGAAELTAPLTVPGPEQLFTEAVGPGWTCNMEQSWARKKFAPVHAPMPGYFLQNWHQDGALGVRFPLEAGPVIPMTELVTCWIPLNSCGVDSPGLEFVCRRQPELAHFTELEDSTLRKRFSQQEFWAPSLDFGDGLVFLNDILHRTFVCEEMKRNRLSVEYRIFPG